MTPTPEHVDVLIIGAGLSGIGAGAHLSRALPRRSYAVLEAREASGGTWDLFRYPGIRSDSDMYTMGYSFRPWTDDEALASGDRILEYVRDTAREYDVDRHIRYRHRVVRASWSSDEARWTVEAEHDGATVTLTAHFLWACRGYYDYDRGHEPEFAGAEEFRGTVVHPQQWPADLDCSGKNVVVVGSGATAVTLIPALADTAAHVTMLQRSPTYILSVPRRDPIAMRLKKWLPDRLAHRLVRWKSIVVAAVLYRLSKARPDFIKGLVRKQNVGLLPEGYDVDTHFTPTYNPWDQRMCFVPNGDLFHAVRRGQAEVVTAQVERFDADGIVLASGRHLDADVVVTATGLRLSPFSDIEIDVDGVKVDPSKEITYRALMLSGVPNFVFTVGYTNASWTLKADLVAEYTCRLLAHMRERGYRSVVPVREEGIGELPFMDFQSGYVLRALDQLPKQGDREPWRLRQSWFYDRKVLRRGDLEDGVLRFR